MQNSTTIHAVGTFGANDYFNKANEIEALCAQKSDPRLFARRTHIAARLREMAAAPNNPVHVDALSALALVDYAAW